MKNKKVLIIFFVLAVVLVLAPRAAFAADQIPISNILEATFEVEENPEIEVGTIGELTNALTGQYTTIVLKDGQYDLDSALEVDRTVTIKAKEEHKAVFNGNITIRSGNVVIDGLTINASSGAAAGISAVLVDDEGTGIEIKNNVITASKNGITILENSTVAIESNIISVSESSQYATYGIQVGNMEEAAGAINITINNNTISGSVYTGSDSVDSSGILLKTKGTVTVGEYFAAAVTMGNAKEAGEALEAQTDNTNGIKVMIIDPDSTNGDMKISDIWYPVPVNLTWTQPTETFMTRSPINITFSASSTLNFVRDKSVVYVIKFTRTDGGNIEANDITVSEAVEKDTPGEFHTAPTEFSTDDITRSITFNEPGRYKLQIYMMEDTAQ